MIAANDEWISICQFDDKGEIVFTQEYMDLTKDLGGGRRKFAAQLSSFWNVENTSGLLDFFGPEDQEVDQFDGIDGHPMDVRDDICALWAYQDLAAPDLDEDWYRDLLRSKLISIKLPKRLIKQYVKAAKKGK